jgi:hypothetical protein
MKTNILLTVASAAILTSSVVMAGQATLSDSELDAIAGKGQNNATFVSTSIDIEQGSGNGNVQIGFYQWDDFHTTDSSYAKGGNSANGTTSNVQNGVVGQNNIFGWGAAAQVNTAVSGSVGDSFASESWGTLMVGGF